MNIENDKDIWTLVKKKLKYDKQINADVYNEYISKSFLFKQIDKNLIISVENKISKTIINNINNKILKIIQDDFKLNVNIRYETYTELKKSNESNETKIIINNEAMLNDKDKFLFDNFVFGKSNIEAYKAAKQVAEKPGKLWNPLFIYGDSGLGKTHLLLSIKNEIIKKFINYRVSYISSEDFGSLAIDNMKKGYVETENFKNEFKEKDVLLIDDIQFLAKRTKTNELFFYILNHFIENDKQIVISSDKMPDELKINFEKRLISRFNSGLNIQVSKPDYDTALEIIKLKLKNKKNDNLFSKSAIEYIARFFSIDVRKLEGTINRMVFYSILQKKRKNDLIEVCDIEEAFKDHSFKENFETKKISVKHIKNIICSEYNMPLKILLSKTRISNIAKARHVAMYFCREMTDLRLIDISQEFNRKDHTTVINAIKKVEKEKKANKEFKKFLLNLENKIKKMN